MGTTFPWHRRQGLRFNLRSLMVAVAILAAILAWVTSQWRVVCQRDKLFASLDDPPGLIWGSEIATNPSPPIPWLRQLMGDRRVFEINFWHATDAQIKAAVASFPEARITLGEPGPWLGKVNVVVHEGTKMPGD